MRFSLSDESVPVSDDVSRVVLKLTYSMQSNNENVSLRIGVKSPSHQSQHWNSTSSAMSLHCDVITLRSFESPY